MTTSKNSPSDSGSDTGSNSWECPECGTTDISRSGASGHLRWKHDYSAERAKREIRGSDSSSGVASVSNSPTSGGVGGFGGDVPGSVPEGEFGETADHVARRMRQVADVSASRKMLESMSGDDGGGSDGDSAERISELKREIRAVRSEVRDGSPAQSGGDAGELATLAQLAKEGDMGTQELAAFAEIGGVGVDPEIRKAELEMERFERKSERRKQLLDQALESLEGAAENLSGGLVESAFELLSGDGGGGRREPAREPSRAPGSPPEPQRAEQPQRTEFRGEDPGQQPVSGDSRVADGGQPAQQSQPESTTRQRFDEVRESQGGGGGGGSRVDVEPDTATETEFRGEDPGEIDDGAEGADETDETDGETSEADQ